VQVQKKEGKVELNKGNAMFFDVIIDTEGSKKKKKTKPTNATATSSG